MSGMFWGVTILLWCLLLEHVGMSELLSVCLFHFRACRVNLL